MGYAEQLGTFSVTIRKKFLSITLPILISSILSGICSFIVYNFFFTESGGGEGPPLATFTDNPFLTALFFVGIAFIGAFGIYLIFKYNKIKLLKAIFATAIALTTFAFIFLIIYSTPYYIKDEFITSFDVFKPSTDIIILVIASVLGVTISVLTVLSMVYQVIPEPWPQVTAMLFAVLAGTFLATFLPTLGAVLVMIGLSIYDIISVFKGPIKKIAELSEERYLEKMKEKEESTIQSETENTEGQIDSSDENQVNEKEPEQEQSLEENVETRTEEVDYIYTEYIELGLGDLAFFGMLFSFALIKLGLFSAIAAFIGVVIGAIFTIKLLEKKKLMPGLPLSIGLGLLFAFGVWGIFALAGYTGFGWISPNWYG